MRTCSVKHTQKHNNTNDEKVDEDICVNRNSSRTRINVNTDIPTNNQYDALAENTNHISVHNDENIDKQVNGNTVKRSITILGDSIIKDIKSYEMKRENTNFTSITSSNRESFGLLNNEVKQNEPGLILNKLRSKNNDRLIVGHLNINFIENKFGALVSLVKDKPDIIMVSETKIDESFPERQFIIEGYSSPFGRDRNSHGGGLLFYIRDDIPCKEIKKNYLMT